jgi:hypothetical protein
LEIWSIFTAKHLTPNGKLLLAQSLDMTKLMHLESH